MFFAKKQDKLDNDFLKRRFSNEDRGRKSVVNDDEGYEDRYYQGEKPWNRHLEPEVVIPKGYNEKMQKDRVQDQGSILERMQQIMDL